jgi:hypothetical protein
MAYPLAWRFRASEFEHPAILAKETTDHQPKAIGEGIQRTLALRG